MHHTQSVLGIFELKERKIWRSPDVTQLVCYVILVENTGSVLIGSMIASRQSKTCAKHTLGLTLLGFKGAL